MDQTRDGGVSISVPECRIYSQNLWRATFLPSEISLLSLSFSLVLLPIVAQVRVTDCRHYSCVDGIPQDTCATMTDCGSIYRANMQLPGVGLKSEEIIDKRALAVHGVPRSVVL